MNMTGKKVTHTKFGKGKIVAVYDTKIDVDFKDDIRSFLYPDSFEKFLVVEDAKTKEFIQGQLDEVLEKKKTDKLLMHRREKARAFVRKQKVKTSSHGVFAMRENKLEDVYENWSISTGIYNMGKTKGMPRVPKNLNMNSACLLTFKPEKAKESERTIVGIFMTPEEFIGEKCAAGIVSAHEKYRIVWGQDQEEIFFWDFFQKEGRLEKWGTTEMKYVSTSIVKTVLEDMMSQSSDDEALQAELSSFYSYFGSMN